MKAVKQVKPVKSDQIGFRIDPNTKQQLERYAESIDRSVAYVLTQMIQERFQGEFLEDFHKQ